jgi:hypothetical protein
MENERVRLGVGVSLPEFFLYRAIRPYKSTYKWVVVALGI